MKLVKIVFLWILFGFFALCTLAFLPHFSCVFSLLTAALLLPVEKWQAFLRNKLKKSLKVTLAIVLALVTFLTVPSTDLTNVIDNSSAQNGTLVSTTVTSGETTQVTTIATKATTNKNTTTTKMTTTTKYTTTTTTKITTTKSPTITTKKTTVKTTTKKSTTTTTANKTKYILNTESKKFHSIYCSRLPTKNREDTTMSREEIISLGYEPCGFCKP